MAVVVADPLMFKDNSTEAPRGLQLRGAPMVKDSNVSRKLTGNNSVVLNHQISGKQSKLIHQHRQLSMSNFYL